MREAELAIDGSPSIGCDSAEYLGAKRERLTPETYNAYRYCLTKVAPLWRELSLQHFEPPAGAELIEDGLDLLWSECAPRTYNGYLSIISDFFRFEVAAGRLQRDPTPLITRARVRPIYRPTFSREQCRAILAAQPHLRDRIAVRLLLTYGLRKGSLRAIRFKHFDHQRRRVEVLAEDLKVGELPIPQEEFWLDLEQHILDTRASPDHYLLCRHKTIPVGPIRTDGRRRVELRWFPEKSLSGHGMHLWWYRCLANGGIVPQGVSRGHGMGKARHTAGQRLMDRTGNLKAVQALLCHTSIGTTACMYPDWDIDDLATTMAEVVPSEDGLAGSRRPENTAPSAGPALGRSTRPSIASPPVNYASSRGNARSHSGTRADRAVMVVSKDRVLADQLRKGGGLEQQSEKTALERSADAMRLRELA